MNQPVKIKRALISVSDKSGLDSLAKALHHQGCEIISTGGTQKVIEENQIPVTDINRVTGNPEAFGGRMKTISFQIESALLFDRDTDKKEADALGIQPIDLVVCNLYPFERVKNRGADFETLIENIDIGGPTMIRAAAKNFKYVTVVTDPRDYEELIDVLQKNDGQVPYEFRFKAMRKAYNLTADYDSMIASTMDETAGAQSMRMAYGEARTLRYGENSHQNGLFLRKQGAVDALYDLQALHGKELSFNNIVDIYSALDSVRDLQNHGCAIIKHNNPCGLAAGDNQRTVFERAWAGDPVSAFGSVIAFNRTVELDTARFLQLDNEDKMQRKFVEVVVAPDFNEDAKQYLFRHTNLRVVKFDPDNLQQEWDIKFFAGSLLVQNADRQLYDKKEWVTDSEGSIDEDLLTFGLIAARQLKSNAIAVVRRTEEGILQLLGMGCGQPNRVNSTELALRRCHDNLKMEFEGDRQALLEYVKTEVNNAVLISDAFFPFPDNIELAAKFDIKTIVQPGGSIRDKAVIQRCNELGIQMMFTGIRHFKH
ncbi:MAG: bifunctional phosphoribosylaminoimidazolecarboxamide formyltransferase/IMP cyclohydrolase [Caldithrix sp.]|nr:bifunctional phosphoribosylaminoimidazolecarboxamide formyltransferase/IMP cyclohydrolase [Caldithrix sp.]